jgi:putative effector of murein hydrolase LrgA (UPF0299 family)
MTKCFLAQFLLQLALLQGQQQAAAVNTANTWASAQQALFLVPASVDVAY